MAGPSNAIMGDVDNPTSVPQTQVPDENLNEEKKLAKFSKTAEFQRLKDYMEGRIQFFQTYLPDGTSVTATNSQDNDTLAAYWRAANVVIAEFRAVLNEYERAAEAVKDARREN